MSKQSPHVRGVVQTALGVLILTPDSLIIRLISADTMTLIFWRGLFQFLAITGYMVLRRRGGSMNAIRAMGRTGLVVACFYAASNIFFITSIRLTTVANTLLILSTAPLLGAIFTRIFLKEHVPWRTWLAAVAGLVGIGIIFAGSAGGGTLLGDLLAFGAACTIGGAFVLIRSAKQVSLVPSVGVTGLIVALCVAPFTGGVALSTPDLGWLLLLGGVITPISFGLITLGPRYIPAPEVSLLMLLETLLGPLWVWVALGEVPAGATWIGGAVLLTAVTINSVLMLREASGPVGARPDATECAGG